MLLVTIAANEKRSDSKHSQRVRKAKTSEGARTQEEKKTKPEVGNRRRK